MIRANTWLKTGLGAAVSSAVTVALYGSGPTLWVLWCMFPPTSLTLIENLIDDQTVAYWETEMDVRVDGPVQDAVVGSAQVNASGETLAQHGGAGAPVPQEDTPDVSALAVHSSDAPRVVTVEDRPVKIQGKRTANRPEGAEKSAAQQGREAMLAQRALVMAKGRKARCKKRHDDIDRLGDEKFKVQRDLVEHYTSNIKRFNSLGWSGPYDNEDVRGWKISGFGCNSPLHFAGLRRGDIILTVNDKNMRTWIQVFGAYRKMKRQDDFDIVLLRRGERHVLHYTLI